MRVWYCICLLFLIYNLNILIDDKYTFTYHLENKSDPIHFAACLDLYKPFPNQSSIDFDLLNTKLSDYFKNVEFKQVTFDYNSSHFMNVQNFILNQINLTNYFVYQNLICIFIDNRDRKEFYIFLRNLKFVVSSRIKFKFYRLDGFYSEINELIVLNLAHPFSNCDESLNRFWCFNDCVKKKNMFSCYYYDGKEISQQINQTNQIIISFDKTKKVLQNERNCINRCKKMRSECKLIYITPRPKGKSESIQFKAYQQISTFDFFFQFLCLICLVSNFSVCHPFFKILNYERFSTYQRILLKFLISLLFAAFTIIFLIKITKTYIDRRDNPTIKEITINLIKPEPQTNLVVCVPINKINQTYYEAQRYESSLFEIERDTSQGINESVQEIYLKLKNKKLQVYWTKYPDVLFFKEKRCLRIRVYPILPKYQNLLYMAKLLIKLKKYESSSENNIYLLSENESFSSRSFENNIYFDNLKRKIKRSQINKKQICIQKYDKNFLDECINKKFIEEYGNLSTHSVINKNLLQNYKWSNLFLKKSEEDYHKIKNQCKKIFQNQVPCESDYFERSVEIDFKSTSVVELDLYYEVITRIEEHPSVYKMLLDLISFQSIFFGLDVNVILLKLVSFISNIKVKYRFIQKILIMAICFIGLAVHILFMLDGIKKMTYSQFYLLSGSIYAPDVVICIEFNVIDLVDLNHKLTFEYLEKVTKEINIQSIFIKIEYLKANEWKNVDLELENLNKEFHIDTFYFMNEKCFSLKLQLEYYRDDFVFENDNSILKILLNQTFFEKKQANFMTKARDKFQLSKVVYLSIKSFNYFFKQELVTIEYNNKFQIFQSDLDDDSYLRNLIDKFKSKFNLKTLYLPMEKKFDLEINNQLFDQFCRQTQNTNDQQMSENQNYKKDFAINYLTKNGYNMNYGTKLDFSLIFFKKVIFITNELNFTSLILSLLNLSSIWFGFGIQDINKVLEFGANLIKKICIFAYKKLKKVKKNCERKLLNKTRQRIKSR